MKIEEKKKEVFVIIGIFAIIMSIYVSNYRSFLSIDDACVNPETGDISYECFQLGKHTVERVCSGLSPLRRDRLWC